MTYINSIVFAQACNINKSILDTDNTGLNSKKNISVFSFCSIIKKWWDSFSALFLLKKSVAFFFILAFTVCLNSSKIKAQSHELKNMKNWQLKGFGKDAIRIGDKYSAIKFYNEFLKRKPDNFRYTYLLAQLYKNDRDYVNAKNSFYNAYTLSKKKNISALFNYALMLKTIGEYDEAFLQLKNCEKELRKKGFRPINKERLVNEMKGIQLSLAKNDSIENYKIIHLDSSINKSSIEFSPIIIDDSTLVYGSSDVTPSEYINLQNGDKQKYRKFFQAKRNNTVSWSKNYSLPEPFKNSENENTGSACFSPEKSRYYFTRCKENQVYKIICNLFVREFSNGIWGQALQLDNRINHPDYTSSQPTAGKCYDDNLDIIYFVSDRPGGIGGYDIWYTVYNKKTKSYTKALNAGVFINTPENEKTPFYDLKNHAMYYSSDGNFGYGGFDIFRSFGDMLNWSLPENMGRPLNSSFDDFCFTVSENNLSGFFTSNRTGSIYTTHANCCDDIYFFNKQKSENILFSTKINLNDITEEFIKNSDLIPDTAIQTLWLEGTVASLYLTEPNNNPVFLAKDTLEKEGGVTFNLMRNKNYKIVIDDKRLIENEFSISTIGNNSVTMKIDRIQIKSIPEKAIILTNILYDFDVATLCDSAKQYIDTTLIPMLQKYIDINIEIYSHTDSKGGESYNEILSQKRAENVILYLTERGIEESRMKGIGIGQKLPVALNTNVDGSDNPDGRRLNRRTELKIDKK